LGVLANSAVFSLISAHMNLDFADISALVGSFASVLTILKKTRPENKITPRGWPMMTVLAKPRPGKPVLRTAALKLLGVLDPLIPE
jgi:hypothetical protein